MKKLLFFLLVVEVFVVNYGNAKPRVFIFTDINIGGGDPDDRQSLVHLLWYADQLEIVGIVPDRWNKKGLEACQMAIDSYQTDFSNFRMESKGYPDPEEMKNILALNEADAAVRFKIAAKASTRKNPLYVLVWGNMNTVGKILLDNPELVDTIRLITIGTGLKYGPKDEVPGEDCEAPNWNGPGRNQIYEDPRFDRMWWLEINWTYNGMFSGKEPKEMFEKLSLYGAMGQHIKFVTEDHEWAQYFRVGDTPSVLYLIDPRKNLDDPSKSSWAGKFTKPFPKKRPNYFTDDNGSISWDYENPCLTWNNVTSMYAHNKSTLENERSAMYQELLSKLNSLYGK